MKAGLEQLKNNFEKLKAIGELYDELMLSEIKDERELEEARMKYDALKNSSLRLLIHSKKVIESIEKEDVP